MQQRRRWLALMCALWISLVSGLFLVSTTAHAQTKVIVHRGDSLWWIAQQQGTSVARLVQMNHLTTDVLQIHQQLVVPDPHPVSRDGVTTGHPSNVPSTARLRYTVKRGDTLWALAVRFHTTVTTLQRQNGIHSSLIYPKQKLWIRKTPSVIKALHQMAAATRRGANKSTQYVHGVPAQFITVYQSAGRRYGIPWTVLAAIHREETNFGTAPEVSANGARGPMQFMPSTFSHYAVKAPGQEGPPNINNVDDAIYTCAHMLSADGYRNNPAGALFLYNHSTTYVSVVRRLASTYAA